MCSNGCGTVPGVCLAELSTSGTAARSTGRCGGWTGVAEQLQTTATQPSLRTCRDRIRRDQRNPAALAGLTPCCCRLVCRRERADRAGRRLDEAVAVPAGAVPQHLRPAGRPDPAADKVADAEGAATVPMTACQGFTGRLLAAMRPWMSRKSSRARRPKARHTQSQCHTAWSPPTGLSSIDLRPVFALRQAHLLRDGGPLQPFHAVVLRLKTADETVRDPSGKWPGCQHMVGATQAFFCHVDLAKLCFEFQEVARVAAGHCARAQRAVCTTGGHPEHWLVPSLCAA